MSYAGASAASAGQAANSAGQAANSAQQAANSAQQAANAITAVTVTQSGYTCTNPISVSSGTITIATNSNAYGRKFVQSTEPSSPCNGDIWYNISGAGGQTDSGGFAVGTTLVFCQPGAPTGWVKDTTHNNKALRVVSGSGGGSGGSGSFTDIFNIRVPQVTADATTLTVGQMPAHNHTTTLDDRRVFVVEGPIIVPYGGPGGYPGQYFSMGNTGGGGSHTHTMTVGLMDFRVQYVDVIICSKQ